MIGDFTYPDIFFLTKNIIIEILAEKTVKITRSCLKLYFTKVGQKIREVSK